MNSLNQEASKKFNSSDGVGGRIPPLAPAPTRPYNQAHSKEWASLYITLPVGSSATPTAGAQTPHPQRPGLIEKEF